MEDATVVWQTDGNQYLGVSNLNTPATLVAGSLPAGTHNLKATVYAPLDTNLEKPLGSKEVKINITSNPLPKPQKQPPYNKPQKQPPYNSPAGENPPPLPSSWLVPK